MSDQREALSDWEVDCLKWRGRVLTGKLAHWCYDWDGLPIDETCDEISGCSCRVEPPKGDDA